jgi:hypothetical protein
MFRNLAAIVIGVITAFVTVMLVDKIGHTIYPPPAGLDFTNPDAIRPYLATLPIGAFLFILASAVVAAFAGTLIACFIGTARPGTFGAVVGGIVLAASVANFIAIPHPLWLSLATLSGIILSTLAAMRLAVASSGRNSSGGDPG